MKKVSFGSKPQAAATPPSPDAWVREHQAAERIKRLTIDISERLHVRIKSQCAMRGQNMADEIRKLLETHFPESSQ